MNNEQWARYAQESQRRAWRRRQLPRDTRLRRVRRRIRHWRYDHRPQMEVVVFTLVVAVVAVVMAWAVSG